MAITINTNIAALQSQRALDKKTKALGENFEKLSAGRLTKMSQDAAGMIIAEELGNDANLSAVAARGISDAVSAANIADSAMMTAGDITARMGELATQAANGTTSNEQRQALDQEYQALKSELDRISQTTQFNGQQLLTGNTMNVVVGTDGSTVALTTPEVSSSALGLTSNLLSQASAQTALDQTKQASESVASARGEVGATVVRFGTAFENLQTTRVNELDAASRIRDVDVAHETTLMTANRIGQQGATALLAQANSQPALALQLLG